MDKMMTRRGFEAWLRGRKSRDVVGYRRRSKSCPLASYLVGMHGADFASVREDAYTAAWGGAGTCIEGALPDWAQHLVGAVDRDGYVGEAVTAQQVRAILRTPHR